MTGTKARLRLWGMRAGLTFVVAAVLLFAVASAGAVMCQSRATGEHVAAQTDYVRTMDTKSACMFELTGFTQKVTSRTGSFESAISGGDMGFDQVTAAKVTGIYRDTLSFMHNTGCASNSAVCNGAGCGDANVTPAYSEALFSSAAMGDNLNVQTAGAVGTAFTGQAYITGTGSGKITAGSLDMTNTTTQHFSQSIRASGHDITAGMAFSFTR